MPKGKPPTKARIAARKIWSATKKWAPRVLATAAIAVPSYAVGSRGYSKAKAELPFMRAKNKEEYRQMEASRINRLRTDPVIKDYVSDPKRRLSVKEHKRLADIVEQKNDQIVSAFLKKREGPLSEIDKRKGRWEAMSSSALFLTPAEVRAFLSSEEYAELSAMVAKIPKSDLVEYAAEVESITDKNAEISGVAYPFSMALVKGGGTALGASVALLLAAAGLRRVGRKRR